MPYVTKLQKFSDGQHTWMESTQVWVDPTPEELAAQNARNEERERLAAEVEQLTGAISTVLDKLSNKEP